MPALSALHESVAKGPEPVALVEPVRVPAAYAATIVPAPLEASSRDDTSASREMPVMDGLVTLKKLRASASAERWKNFAATSV